MCSNITVCSSTIRYHTHTYINIAFGSSVVITVMILWFAFDMIKNGALYPSVGCNSKCARRIELNEKCITHKTKMSLTHTYIFEDMASAQASSSSTRITMPLNPFTIYSIDIYNGCDGSCMCV